MSTNRHILIIEDDINVAEMLELALEREGYTCQCVHDGLLGVEEARKIRPDLILLDRRLPGQSGDQVLRELRRNPETAALPVILLTGKCDETDEVVGLALGADDYIGKPFSAKVLLARVEALLRRATPSGASLPIAEAVSAEVSLDRKQFMVCIGQRSVSLSKVEYRILATLMAARGHLLDANTLLGLVVGKKEHAAGQSELDPHIAALQRKLGPASKCIQHVHGAGYAYCAPDYDAAEPRLVRMRCSRGEANRRDPFDCGYRRRSLSRPRARHGPRHACGRPPLFPGPGNPQSAAYL